MKRTMSWLLTALLAFVLLSAGCSLFESKPDSSDQARAGALGRYYDFDDIQVPVSLKLNKEKSLIFRVGSFKAGMMSFSDNLEVESLVNFFVDSMGRDNWTLKGSYKYPKVALFFAKQNKTCIVMIIERTFTTEVEIWVAPAGQNGQ